MDEDPSRSLQMQLQAVESTGRVVVDLVTRMRQAHEDHESFLHDLANHLDAIAGQEDDTRVAKCLDALSACGRNLATECHEVMIERPVMEMLHVVKQLQDHAVRPMKELLADRAKARAIETKLQREYDELKRGSSAKDKKLRLLSDQKRRVDNVNALLETHAVHFARYRTEKMKKIVTEVARSQAFYHAKGLELFAVPCQAIAEIDTADGKGAAQGVVRADAT